RVSAIWVDQETGLSEIAYYDATARRVKYAEEKPATTSVGPAKGTGMEARLSVWPNPGRVGRPIRLAFEILGDASADVRGYDVSGRLLWKRTAFLTAGRSTLDIDAPSSTIGMVFVEARLSTGQVLASKTVVLR